MTTTPFSLALALAASLAAPPAVSPDVLEPSLRNEVDHALARGLAAAAQRPRSPAERDFLRRCETNALSATALALRLVSAQRADGRWLDGTNDITAAACEVLSRLAAPPRAADLWYNARP